MQTTQQNNQHVKPPKRVVLLCSLVTVVIISIYRLGHLLHFGVEVRTLIRD